MALDYWKSYYQIRPNFSNKDLLQCKIEGIDEKKAFKELP